MDPARDPDLTPGVGSAQLTTGDVAVRSGEAEGRFGRGQLLGGLTHGAHRSRTRASPASVIEDRWARLPSRDGGSSPLWQALGPGPLAAPHAECPPPGP